MTSRSHRISFEHDLFGKPASTLGSSPRAASVILAGTMRYAAGTAHYAPGLSWALSSMMPKAVPAAPLGLLARQCHADADVETAAAIVAPINIAIRKRPMIALPEVSARNSRLSRGDAATAQLLVAFVVFRAFVCFVHDTAPEESDLNTRSAARRDRRWSACRDARRSFSENRWPRGGLRRTAW